MKVDVSLCGSIPRSCFKRVAVSNENESANINKSAAIDTRAWCEKGNTNNPGLIQDPTHGTSGDGTQPTSQSTSRATLLGEKSLASRNKVCPTLAGNPVKVSHSARLNSDEETRFHSSTSVSKERDQTADGCSKPLATSSDDKEKTCSLLHHFTKSISGESLSDMSTVSPCEVPSWAVPAKGYSQLEPIRDGNIAYRAIDLTQQSIVNVGRSPSNDVVLVHRTSSRRHAAVFNHPSGACYVQDCHSAHGTYINGSRVPAAALVRIKRGSLVRFGGPGAPSFIFKCFSTTLDKMVQDLDGVASSFEPKSTGSMSFLQKQAEQTGVACIRGDSGMACVVDGADAPVAALVLLNTRVNASGGLSSLSESRKSLAQLAQSRYEIKSNSGILKRCRDETNPVNSTKRTKYSAVTMYKPILSYTPPFTTDAPPCAFVTPSTSLEFSLPPPRKVSFSDEQPNNFYAAAVTPDELSSDSEAEEEEPIVVMNPVGVLTA